MLIIIISIIGFSAIAVEIIQSKQKKQKVKARQKRR